MFIILLHFFLPLTQRTSFLLFVSHSLKRIKDQYCSDMRKRGDTTAIKAQKVRGEGKDENKSEETDIKNI